MLCFLATLNIFSISFKIFESFAFNLFHDYFIQLILLSLSIIGAFALLLFNMLSIMCVHIGFFLFRLIHFFIHITSIASILVLISGMFRPPWFLGAIIWFQPIISLFFPSHRKSLNSFFILSSTCFGIPFTVVKNISIYKETR
jgi:hypothetical protein